MPKLPAANGRETIRALRSAGFVVMRQRSSHVTLRHPGTARSVTVTDHGSRDLPAGTLHGILTDAGLTAEEFRRLLR